MQQADLGELADSELRTVTKRVPTAEEMHTLRFAWKVSKHVKSTPSCLHAIQPQWELARDR